MKNWTITDTAGALLAQLCLADDAHPFDEACGMCWSAADHIAVETEDQADPAISVWRDGQWQSELSLLDIHLFSEIDRAAGEARKTYMTAIPDQVEIYRLKEAQARAFLAQPGAELTAFPALVAEVAATGLEALAAAAGIVSAADAANAQRWHIETRRLAAKRAVAAADTAEAKQAAAVVDWSAYGEGDL